MKYTARLLAMTLSLAPMPIIAVAGDSKPNMDKSSNVDTEGKKAAAPGSHPASPGTVGAMNTDGGGSFTAPEADHKKKPLK